MYSFKALFFTCIGGFFSILTLAQSGKVTGKVFDAEGKPLEAATLSIPQLNKTTLSDGSGTYELSAVPFGQYTLEVQFVGFSKASKRIHMDSLLLEQNFTLNEHAPSDLEEVVISGTMREVSRLESPVPVEVYTSGFFKANPTPSLFDALQHINGVRPQLNCNVCNTGDIHINGLEGPYTMVLIDGMPLVSGLSTVYGLTGIPQSLIDRLEVVKGPASTLYGSEAVGGLINIITKSPGNAPAFSADVFGTSWKELNADLAAKFNLGKKVRTLLGINYFNFQNPVDKNLDNFTDVTQQNRISIFNKWGFERKENRVFSLASRFVYEDRWGGEKNWKRKHRGGNEVYGESIYLNRWEVFGTYQFPFQEKILLQFSGNRHHQNSAYGEIPYLADQYVGFGQLIWFKKAGKHDLLTGFSYRHTYYKDNTPATADLMNPGKHKPSLTKLPGVFLQNEFSFDAQNTVLLGVRYDYNSLHGSILSPRFNYKWSSKNKSNVLRMSVGNGYRVANVFTEDHAALTGARKVVFTSELNPETSWNGNLNFSKKMNVGNAFIAGDATVFYTYFNNKIIPDYDSNPNLILYDNLHGHAVSKGVSLNVDLVFPSGLKMIAGATLMDVYRKEGGEKERQLFTERFSGTWNIGYSLRKLGLSFDYTGNVYGPMRLPLQSQTDPRKDHSPWWSVQNIQLTKKVNEMLEIYGGVKNLLNWTPHAGNPFIIARAHDPFDKKVEFDAQGAPLVTAENPYGLTFDPDYVFAPNQGIRGFLGFRYVLF